jgi:hypothetical protein
MHVLCILEHTWRIVAVIAHRSPAKERTFYLAAHSYHDAGTERENTKEGILCTLMLRLIWGNANLIALTTFFTT